MSALSSLPNEGNANLNIKTSTEESDLLSANLLCAAEKSDETWVLKFIARGANVNCHDGENKTPLHHAAYRGWLRVVDLLLQKGADPDIATFGENITPLHHAAYRGWLSVVDLLLQKGADPDITTTWGITSLLIACFKGYKDIAELLSKYSKSLDYFTEECNSTTFHLDQCVGWPIHWTALHFASRFGWQEIVKLLVERGANINARNSNGKTPLLVAFAYRQKDIVELLVDLGADLTCCDKNEWALWHRVVAHGLINRESIGIDLEVRTAGGRTPLCLATPRNKKIMVSFLIKARADIESYSNEKQAVLWFALRNGWLEVLKLLVKRGVDLDKEMPSGDIPILMSAASRKTKIVHFLIKLGVDLKRCDQKGWTVLHYASRNKWPDVARAAVEGGCDVNAVNGSGNTPLHILCDFSRSPNTEMTSESVQTVEVLIEKGADVDVENSRGETPLYLASKYSQYPGVGPRGLSIFNCLLIAQGGLSEWDTTHVILSGLRVI